MIPQAKKSAVIKMLARNKYSLRKIAMVTGVSWGTVKAFRDNLHKTKERNHIALRPNIYKDMSTTKEAQEQLPALLCLANDIQELASLGGINNLLFSSLVNRARIIYNLILRKKQ